MWWRNTVAALRVFDGRHSAAVTRPPSRVIGSGRKMIEAPAYAQTIIQLLNQAAREGYTSDDIALYARAYQFALPVFSGRFRASGKTFFAHLVGTASVLASLREDAALVAAGLLHAAYTHGDFGNGGRGMTESTRAVVRSAAGERVEAYIARYTEFEWSAHSLPRLASTLERLDESDRLTIVMRLANELDDHLDFGMLYEGGDRERVNDYIARTGAIVVELADRLGRPRLAHELTRIFTETLAAEIPCAGAVTPAADESFVVLPTSAQKLRDAVAGRLSSKPPRT